MGEFDPLINPVAPAQTFAAIAGSGVCSAQAPVEAAELAVSGEFGTVFEFDGSSYPCVIRLPLARDIASLADGAEVNEANPDIRWLTAPCGEFPDGDYPAEGARIALAEAGAGVSFAVLSRTVDQIAGVDTQVRLLIYRTPEPASATVSPAGETGAGQPKAYVPPVNPY